MMLLAALAPLIVLALVALVVKALIRFAKVREGGAHLHAVAHLHQSAPATPAERGAL